MNLKATVAGSDKFGGDPQSSQVALLFQLSQLELFQECGEGGGRQARQLIVASKNGSLSTAEGTLELNFLFVLLMLLLMLILQFTTILVLVWLAIFFRLFSTFALFFRFT